MKPFVTMLVCISILLLAGYCLATEVVEKYVGLWQFPDRKVWIQINADGTALQCRIAQNNVVIKSDGKFEAPNRIVWEEIWGNEVLSLEDNALTISGKFGDFRFMRATDQMLRGCNSSN